MENNQWLPRVKKWGGGERVVMATEGHNEGCMW